MLRFDLRKFIREEVQAHVDFAKYYGLVPDHVVLPKKFAPLFKGVRKLFGFPFVLSTVDHVVDMKFKVKEKENGKKKRPFPKRKRERTLRPVQKVQTTKS